MIQATDPATSTPDTVQTLAQAIREAATLLAKDHHGIDWSAIAAFLAVLVSFISLWTNGIVVRQSLDRTIKSEFDKLELAFRMRQLDFYGRLHILNHASRVLYEKLTRDKPHNWHFLNHATSVLADPTEARLMKEILKINDTIASLLESKGGLLHDVVNPPDSFNQFLRHQRLVSAAMSKSPLPSIENADTFPKDFDQDILDACKKTKTRIDHILRGSLVP